MLVSHNKQFIFTKTLKSASTSLEIFFQSECLPDDKKALKSEPTEEIISDSGIVGFRGSDPTNKRYYNHMPIGQIKNLIGPERFDNYFKFCTIRNPFDKMVSAWWHFLGEEQRNEIKHKDFQYIRQSFSEWILSGVWKLGNFSLNDKDKYFIGPDMVMDSFIKYENFHNDIRSVMDKLKINRTTDDLGYFKSNMRKIDIHFSEYYSSATKNKVHEIFNWEIHNFNYSLF